MLEAFKKIGQLFIIGFPERKPSPAFLNFIQEENIGGVILFASNCPTHQMVEKNIRLISDHCRESMPFIAVDQEGGRVTRIHGAPAEFDSAEDYGSKLGIDTFEEDFSRSALCLEKLGINLVLAPVCDIFLNEKNKCLGGRCFGRSAHDVVPFVERAVDVCHKYGLLSCLKHFPGLGAAEIDPHEKTAVAPYDELVWEQRERLPFAAGIEKGADMVMTTHVELPALDNQIVTASDKIISTYLRERLAFDGPVITDDLTMKGAARLGSVGNRAVAAFNAGHDLLLFGQDIDAAMEAYEHFKNAVQRGEVPVERLKASLDRIAGIKFKLGKSVLY
ncbi:MAG: glycoside hydrolase family 3 N-terminal domain-containing protein [Candidatus Zixiibacteriota bacterium]